MSNEGQVTGLKGSRGEKRLIPADGPLEPLCCRERRKGGMKGDEIFRDEDSDGGRGDEQ